MLNGRPVGTSAELFPTNASIEPKLSQDPIDASESQIDETWLYGVKGKEESTDGLDELADECDKAKAALQNPQGSSSAEAIFSQLQKQFTFIQEKKDNNETEYFFGVNVGKEKDLRLIFVKNENLELGIFEYRDGAPLREILACMFCKDGTALVDICEYGKQKNWENNISRLKDVIKKGFNVKIEMLQSRSLKKRKRPSNKIQPPRKITHHGSLKFFARKKEEKYVIFESVMQEQSAMKAVTAEQPVMQPLLADDAFGSVSNFAKIQSQTSTVRNTSESISMVVQPDKLTQKTNPTEIPARKKRRKNPKNSVAAKLGKNYYSPLTKEHLEILKKESAHLPLEERMQHVFFNHAKAQKYTHTVKTNSSDESKRSPEQPLTYQTTIYTIFLEFINSKGEHIPLQVKITPTKLFQPKYNGLQLDPVKVQIMPTKMSDDKKSETGSVSLQITPTPSFDRNGEGRMDPSSWMFPESVWKSKADIVKYYDFRVYHGDDEILFDFGAELAFPATKELTAEDEQKLQAQIATDLQTRSLPDLIKECKAVLAKERQELGESIGELHSLHANGSISGTDAMELYCSSFHDVFNRQSTGLVDDSKFTNADDTYRIPLRLIFVIMYGETYYERLMTGVTLQNGIIQTAFDGDLDQDTVRRVAAISAVQNYQLEAWFDALLEQRQDNPQLPENNEFPTLLATIAKQYFSNEVDLSKPNPFAGSHLTVKQLVIAVYSASQELMKKTSNREPTLDLINLSRLLCDGIKLNKNEIFKPCDPSKKIFQFRKNINELLWCSYFWQMKNPTIKKKPDNKRKAEEDKQASQSNKRARLGA